MYGDARAPERRLSVLHVLAPAPAGGLERVVQALARGQAASGHSVTVAPILAPSGEASSQEPLPNHTGVVSEQGERPKKHTFLAAFDGTSVTVSPVTVRGRGYLQERAQIVAIARQCGAQIAHTHGYRPDVVDASALRARGIPVVTTVHGFTGGGWRNRMYESAQRWAFRRFHAVVAVSEPMAAKLLASGVPASRLHVIANSYAAISTPLEREAARALLGLPPDAYVIGWVGRLSREKGLDVLLDALAMTGERPVVVAVIGAGREQARLEAQAAGLSLVPAIRWLGLVPDAGRLYRAFDVFVLSSRTEGTPMALFEAMDADVPILTTAVGGVPAVVTRSEAVLVAPEQPAALADGLRAIWLDPASARLRAAAAHERLRSAYGIGPWVARYDAVYASATRFAAVSTGTIEATPAPRPSSAL